MAYATRRQTRQSGNRHSYATRSQTLPPQSDEQHIQSSPLKSSPSKSSKSSPSKSPNSSPSKSLKSSKSSKISPSKPSPSKPSPSKTSPLKTSPSNTRSDVQHLKRQRFDREEKEEVKDGRMELDEEQRSWQTVSIKSSRV